jgi:hypothetical protein
MFLDGAHGNLKPARDLDVFQVFKAGKNEHVSSSLRKLFHAEDEEIERLAATPDIFRRKGRRAVQSLRKKFLGPCSPHFSAMQINCHIGCSFKQIALKSLNVSEPSSCR